MQQYTIEYRVSGSLDGATPSPVFSVDPSSPDYKAPDPDSIYRFEVENLGYIDPDFDTGGSQGDRFLRAVTVMGGLPPASTPNIGVLAVEDVLQPGNVIFLEEVGDLSGGPFRLPIGCVFIPQGAVLGLSGVSTDDPAGNPILVRLSVDVPDSTVEYAQMLQACCCENVEEEDGPCTPTTVGPVDPFQFAQSDLPLTMTLSGSGFEAGVTTVEFEFGYTFENLQVISSTEMTIDLPVQSLTPSPAQAVTVSNGEGCSSSFNFRVLPPV